MKLRLNYLDVLSGIAILGVVLIHAHAYYMIDGAKFYSDSLPWAKWPFLDNILDFVITYSVCLFLFIAGFKYEVNTDIHDIKSYLVYVKKRFNRIIIPFWVITFFIVCYHYIFGNSVNTNIWALIKIFWNALIGKAPFFYQYWFIPMFIFVSLAYPLFRKLIKNPYLRLAILLALKILIDFVLHGKYFPWPLGYLSFVIYFEIGALFYRNLKLLLTKKFIISIISVFAIIFIYRNLNINPVIDAKILEALKLVGPMVSFYVAYYLNRFRFSKILSWLGYYSWTIYLYHEPFFVSTAFKYSQKMHIDKYFFNVFLIAAIGIAASVCFQKLITLLALLNGKVVSGNPLKKTVAPPN